MSTTTAPGLSLEGTDKPLRITLFAIRRTGLRPAETWVRIGPYRLSCVPFQLSRHRAIFLAALSASEIRLLKGFRQKPCRVGLVFGRAGGPTASIVLRGALQGAASLRDGRGVSLLDVSLLACPSDLDKILQDCLGAVDGLKRLYTYFAGHVVALNQINKPLVAFNGLAEIRTTSARAGANITSLAVDRMTLAVWDPEGAFGAGTACVVRALVSEGYFEVNGTVTSRRVSPEGHVEVELKADFAPELVELVDKFFLNRSLAWRKMSA